MLEQFNNDQAYQLFLQEAHIPENIVGGWLEDLEAFLLYLAGQECAEVGLPAVELGSFQGRSACHFCKGSENKVLLTCIDLWQYPPNCGLDPQTGNIFLKNCKSYIEAKGLVPLTSDTADAAKQFKDDSIHCLFVDGDHSTVGIDRDFKAWYPKVKKDGLILFHDYGNSTWPEVQPYVDSLIQQQLIRRVTKRVTTFVSRKI